MMTLQRTLGLPMLTFYGAGMILGAGIYSVIGKAAGHTGDSLWWGFLLAGFVALLTAFSYAELAAMFPKAGAEYVYLSTAFEKNKWFAETIGVAMAFSGAATAATVALAFTGYLDRYVEVPNIAVAVAVLVLFTALAIYGIRESGWANIVFTLIEVGGLVLIIYLGVSSEKFGEALSAVPDKGTLTGAALIVFSYFGFENIVNLSEEAKEPERQVPAAIFISLGVSLVLYLLVSLSALALLPVAELAASDAALMSVAAQSSAQMGKVLGGIALFSTANTVLISLVGASRILFGMSEQKALPQAMRKVLPSRRTPWIASLVVLAAALSLLPLGKVETVASVSALTTMVAFLSVHVTLISLRFTHAKRKRPFRVPGRIGRWPLIPVFGAIASVVFLFQFTGTVYLVGGVFLIVTALVFALRDRFAS